MRIFNKKILFAKRKRFTFLISIADFSSQECYEVYFQFSLEDPWWFPKYEPEFGDSKVPLYGWLCFYFGRRSIGVLVPSNAMEESKAKKPIYDCNGRLWHLYAFPDSGMAKDFRKISKKYRRTISVECKDGKCTIVNTISRKRIFVF